MRLAEAWCLAGKNKQVGEAAWKIGVTAGRPPFAVAQLKRELDDTDRPALELETERLTAEANRLAAAMETLETLFPAGFGTMAQEIRSWKTIP